MMIKIRKPGPFHIPAITPDYPFYAQLLAREIANIKELPDFSDDKKIFVMSDFGGEHQSADFNTYSFLILSQDKIGPFEAAIKDLRAKHNLLDPYSEFSFKKLKSGGRSRALIEFLELTDRLIHGAIITISVDKNMESVFGMKKREAHARVSEQLKSDSLGNWKGQEGEKVLRVCHAIAIFMALTTYSGQKFLWYCDNDSINEDANQRNFSHTQEIFLRVLAMYTDNQYKTAGFAKSFKEPTYLNDLLSIPDLAAGIVQDLLQNNMKGKEIEGGNEKIELMKWIARPSSFLSKITLVLTEVKKGEWGAGLVKIDPI